MIVDFLKLIDKDGGATMDDVANVIMGFIHQAAGDKGAGSEALEKMKHHMEAKLASAKKQANEQVKQDNKEMDKKNAENAKVLKATEKSALHDAEKEEDHVAGFFLELANHLELEAPVDAKKVGAQAAAATTAGINAGIDAAKHQLNKSTGGAQAKIMKMITNPKNLAKIVKFLEKIFDKLLKELQTILKGDFVTSLMGLMHMEMEVHVYATDARNIFLKSEKEIDAIFFLIFASIFFATLYGLALSMSAVGWLFGYCKCCASCCVDPEGYLKEDEYKEEGPCLDCFPCRAPWQLVCCSCCKEKPNSDRCSRLFCKCCVKTRGCCRSWCCDLRNAYTCATIWISTNFCLLLIPLTLSVGLIVAAFILWYGSCYGINLMNHAICKLLGEHADAIGIDIKDLPVCSGQGPCDTVTKQMPIAAMLVGAGTLLLFFCQYQILGAMWKNYYHSRAHLRYLSGLEVEIDEMAKARKKKYAEAHPDYVFDHETEPLLKKEEDEADPKA